MFGIKAHSRSLKHSWIKSTVKGNSWLNLACGYILIVFCSIIQTAVSATTQSPSSNVCQQSTNFVTVDCSSRNITDINTTMSSITSPNMVNYLDLSGNQLQRLDAGSFTALKQLVKVHLQNNALSFIDPTAFEGLNNLQELYLDYNSIQTLPSTMFQFIPKLIILSVSSNNLQTLPRGAFQQLVNLKQLYLQFNTISTVDSGAFNGLGQVELINLAGNQLPQIVNGTFQTIPTLKNLNISYTRLVTLHGHALQPLNAIQVLDISGNRLSTVSNETVTALRHMTNLASFNASNNPIQCDCNIKTFLIWIQNLTFASINTVPSCNSPAALTNINLLKVSVSSVTSCDVITVIPKTTTKDPNKLSLEPLPYNPMLGWYTAAVLSSILVLFLFCLVLDKLKRTYYKHLKRRLKRFDKNKLNTTMGADENQGYKDGLDTPTMLCSISLAEEADEVAENTTEYAEPLNGDRKDRKDSVSSNTSNKLKLAQENSRRNSERAVFPEGYQPVLGAEGKDNRSIVPPYEILPGLTILEVNPECPLHGSGYTAKPVSQGAYNVPSNVTPNDDYISTKL